MEKKYSQKDGGAKYQSQNNYSQLGFGNAKPPTAAAEQLAKLQEQRKQFAKQIKQVMGAAAKKSVPFKKEIVGKFKQQLVGILIMPPKPNKQEAKPADINAKPDILCIIELKNIFEFSKKLAKKQEIEKKIKAIGKKKLTGYDINVVMVSEIWDMCLKGRYDILNILSIGQPIYDNGWLGALRMVEIHKLKVLKKFEKYVVCYVLAGSMVRGDTTETSDVDTYVVIDDTDVTRMTSAELKSRLMGIIWGYAQEAAMAAGVDNKLNVQVYILSDMWDSIKSANPVIVTFLRDGVPLYDRGMFAPWKLLLNKGKIKPTPEAITNYMKAGQQIVHRIESKLKEIAVEDFFWATSTPTQGALMLLGFPPPTPKELASEVRKHIVSAGLFEEKYVKIWERILQIRKDIEHGKIKSIDGKTVARLLEDTKAYLKRLDILFKEIEKKKIYEEVKELYNKTIEDCLAALAMIGKRATKQTVFKVFKKELVEKQLAPKRYYTLIRKIEELKKTFATTREQIASLAFEQDKLAKELFNIIRAEIGLKVEKFKISAKYANGKKTAGIWLFTKDAYIILDINSPTTNITHYQITPEGELVGGRKAKLEDIEVKLKTFIGTPTAITKKTIDSLKKILADDVKIVIGA